jgi:hypothetical protein
MRPSGYLLLGLCALALLDGGLFLYGRQGRAQQLAQAPLMRLATAELGLTDLCVATEARYTRHPAVSDGMVPFMDHPAGLEHFPSGSFFAPPMAGPGAR